MGNIFHASSTQLIFPAVVGLLFLGNIFHASSTDKKFINLLEEAKEEQEANNYASQQLIPNHLWKTSLLPQVTLNKPWIIQAKYSQWASDNHLNKWIVLGRISYETGMHKFRNDESRKIN